MPIPQPRQGETHEDFHHRCMSDSTMNKDYPDMKQRNAICFRTWDDKDKKHGAAGTVPLLAFSHNSTAADSEPAWSSVDKSKLPRAAFADQGEPDTKSTWAYPHHWVKNGGNEDENGVYTTGTLYLHRGGLHAAWSAANGGRSGQKASAEVMAHLERHRHALGLDKADDTSSQYPLRQDAFLDTPECFRAHLGIWAIEPYWLQQALEAVKLGLWPAVTPKGLKKLRKVQASSVGKVDLEALSREQGSLYAQTDDGVAVVRIVGQITKGLSKFGGTSTVMTRRAIRQAACDSSIKAIMLAIDSPGGQVAGVQDLAEEVKRARQQKPVLAFIEDLGASAAYWIASQAQRITANQTAEIGSIGVMAVLEDLSGLTSRNGVQVHVVTTGPYKAVGVKGAPVLPDHLAYLSEMVGHMGAFFFDAVQQGRRLSQARLAAVTDGRVWIASEAQQLGLLDGVQSFDDALTEAATMRPRRRMGADSPHVQLRAAWETV